ncbi:MAG: 3-dehydroquinate synthase [Planctomycetes bacterium]|nr:3-dehydroquinate synthase [Planctomycetota bacterium]
MENTRVPVALGERSYDVVIGERLMDALIASARVLKPTSIFLVTDSNVGLLHADFVRNAIVANHVFTVPAGENSKSLRVLEGLFDDVFATRKLDRQSLVVALGGGVVGDLAGFLAATLLRGVRCIHVPTSLLAMVDSSVGGKTAINHQTGKNLIGAFHQPVGVFCDLHFLETLPAREYVSAIAEIVKTAAIGDADLLAYLETNTDALLRRNPDVLRHVLARCISFKASVVAEDEMESGRRATLNLGHTLAHVIEAALPEEFLHGEAVAIGLVAALRLSVAHAGLDAVQARRVGDLLARFGLPVEVPAGLTTDRLLEIMASDKKRAGDVIRFIVTPEIGRASVLPCGLDGNLAASLLGRT